MCYDRIASLINPESVICGTRNQHLRVEIEFDIMDNVFVVCQLGIHFLLKFVENSDRVVLAGNSDYVGGFVERAGVCRKCLVRVGTCIVLVPFLYHPDVPDFDDPV